MDRIQLVRSIKPQHDPPRCIMLSTIMEEYRRFAARALHSLVKIARWARLVHAETVASRSKPLSQKAMLNTLFGSGLVEDSGLA